MKIFIIPIFRGWTTCSSSNELVSELTALPTHTHKPRAGGAIKVFGGGGEGPAVLGLGLSLSGFQGFTSHFAGLFHRVLEPISEIVQVPQGRQRRSTMGFCAELSRNA